MKKETESKTLFHEQALATLKTASGKVQGRIDNLFNLLLDGIIKREDYEQKLEAMKLEQQNLLARMKEHTNADKDFYLNAAKVFDIANRAQELFLSSEPEEKRQIIQFLVQNLTLEGKNLYIKFKKPFDSLAEIDKSLDINKGRFQSLDQNCPMWLLNHKNIIKVLENAEYMTNLEHQYSYINELLKQEAHAVAG